MAVGTRARRFMKIGLKAMARLLLALVLFLPLSLEARADNAQYFYDPGGRLIGVIDPTVGSARYNYDQAGNITSIARTPIATLSVMQFYPLRGTSGTTVTVNGTGFGNTTNTTVKFNGVSATPSAVTQTSITVAVPAGASTGALSVTVSGNTVGSAVFTVAGAPVAPSIVSFTPVKQVQGGTVAISGTNFDTVNSKAYVNGQSARITAVTASSLTIEVPPASSGQVTVETLSGKANSSADLIVPKPPLPVASVFATVRANLGGSPTSIGLGASGTVSLALIDPVPGHRIAAYVDLAGSTSCSIRVPGAFLLPPGVATEGKSFCRFEPLLRSPVLSAETVSLELRPTAAGSATIKFYDLPPDLSATLTLGSLTTLTTSVMGQQAIFKFEGTKDQRMAIWLDVSAITPQVASYVLAGPDGMVLQSDSSFAGKGFAEQQLVTLLETGTHTLTVAPKPPSVGDTGTGAGPVQVAVFNSSDVFQPIAVNGTKTTYTITNPGQNYIGTFTGTANQRISILTNASGVVLPVEPVLTGPTGELSGHLATDGPMWMADDLNPHTNRITLPVAGPYQLRIKPTVKSPFSGDTPSITYGTGTYEVTAFNVPADINGGAFTIGGAQKTVTFTVPGQDAVFTVNATTAGQKIKFTFDLTGMLTPNTPCGHLKVNNGATPDRISFCGATHTTEPVTLPTTGSYGITWVPTFSYPSNEAGTGVAKINVTASP